MGLTVLVPWQGGCIHREDAWRWVRERYEALGWPICVSELKGEWSKAAAVMERAPVCADIVVIADADCWCEGTPQAVQAVIDGAEWAVPHTQVRRLTHAATRDVLAGADPVGQPTIEPPYRGVKGGGIVVVRRKTLLEVPFDRRFVGWGKTDRAWRDAMQTLVGEPWRGTVDLTHFWHPPQPRVGRIGSSPANERLYARYRAAKGDRARMRELVDECSTP